MGAVWDMIRAEHARQLAARPATDKTTQKRVATGGGTKQNNVSRLPKTKRGPTVETFVRILLGNGLRPSSFFAAFESQLREVSGLPTWSEAPSIAPRMAPPTEAEIVIALGRAIVHGYPSELARLLAERDAPTKKRR